MISTIKSIAWRAALNRRLNFIQRHFRQNCVLCGADCANLLCPPCERSLSKITAACPQCARPGQAQICGHCLREPPQFQFACAAWRYEFPLDKLIHALKYGEQLALARFFGAGLATAVRNHPRPDFILPMPLHPRRLIERGFNQAQLIAARVAAELDISLAPHLAARSSDTMPQASLALSGRHKNVRNAFIADTACRGLHIAIVDDVMASGATANELARSLMRAGASAVSVWVVARAVAD